MQLYDTVDEGHTDAVACRKVPVPTTEERLEYLSEVFVRNSDAIIRKPDIDLIVRK